MDLLLREDLERLLEKPIGPCVSIFVPTHQAGAETQQDPIRLKNLLSEAREGLLARGLRSAEADWILEPAERLLEDGIFWRHQSDGLAVFLSPGVSRCYRLPLNFKELVVVADYYHPKPVLPLLVGDGQFYVLALSQNEVRLLRATRRSAGDVNLPNAPENLADALKYDDTEKQLQFHTGTSGRRGGRAAIFHGHGADNDPKDDILRYFRRIDRGVQGLLKGSRAPLVLAGVDYLLPIYREASTYSHLADGGIAGNPEGLSAEELRKRAWSVVRPLFSEAQQEAAARYERAAGTEQASTDLSEIVPAAYFGRVDLLFVALDSQRWGTFDPGTAKVSLHEEAASGDGDLLDLAAIRTLLSGGTVYGLDHQEMPNGASVASVFRY